MTKILITTFLLFLLGFSSQAQNNKQLIQTLLNDNRKELNLTKNDIQDWIIYDSHRSKQSGVTYVYIRQRYNGIEVFNAIANFAIKDEKMLYMGNRLEAKLAERANSMVPKISPLAAVKKAAEQLNLTITTPISILTSHHDKEFTISKGGISLEHITAKLVYQPDAGGRLRLAWNINIYEIGAEHWWNLRLDANNGNILEKEDWVIKCQFPDNTFGQCKLPSHQHHRNQASLIQHNHIAHTASEQYRVFAYPLESPNHGSRTLEVTPYDALASPFGWHDDNGAAGAEYTITRGNNVYAYEDRAENNAPGYAPDGTAALNFDFPLNQNQTAANYEDAAITNLFYWNNLVHDIWYHSGFDEASGNFQANNYGNGGLGGDYVYAEAQDGGGSNNANFATPPDGSNPRMQMYLWSSTRSSNLLTINSPSSIAGVYDASQASFGSPVSTVPITADLVLVDDGTTPNVNDACEAAINNAALNGKIAVVYRGNCNFTVKVANAQAAGALAVVVINNRTGVPIGMSGTDPSINIPSIMVSDVDGAALVTELSNGTVNATIVDNATTFAKDGDFDNGIIAHEYGHGISTRLTGGSNNSSCLQNNEQMGEGWSDFFGLMMTIEAGDMATDRRGIGTFAVGESTSGGGIRNAPYTTDMSINGYTYDDVNDTNRVSMPHGVGFVWCTMLWDLNWALIDQYGYDDNLYTGTGGNNMCMKLVIEGCKLQSCSPGFVDARDAILAADVLLYGGANQCLIWEVFANRGLGYSANQGSSYSRTDQTEAFDLPPSCQTPTAAPVADFDAQLVASCRGVVNFEDLSTSVPQSWNWDFGDGSSSTIQDPAHTYSNSGNYTVRLIVDNTIGSDTLIQMVTISLLAPPSANDLSICAGDAATIVGNASNHLVWYDATGTIALDTTTTFVTPPLASTTTYMIENAVFFPSQYVGANLLGAQANGNYHNTGFVGTQNFEAYQALTLVSANIDAGSSGPKTITLWDDENGNGNIIDQVTINPNTGIQRVALNLEIPGPGTYSIGGASINLFRSNANVSYPHTLPGLLSITSSSADTDPLGFWYYLYDWEVQKTACRSAKKTVTVSVDGAIFSYVNNALNVDFTDQSATASSWLWDFGDGNTSTVQNPTHSYTTAGTYTVTLIIDGDATCSYTQLITINPVMVTQFSKELKLSIMPNPANSRATLSFNQKIREEIQLQLIATDGRIIQKSVIPVGVKLFDLDLSGLPPALYFVRLNTTTTSQTLKLTKKD